MDKKYLILIGLLFFSGLIFAQTTFCLKFSEVSNDGNNIVLKIEMQGNEAFALGSSNLQFSFNQDLLNPPTLVSSPMEPPFYYTPTVTNPLPSQGSLNIELGFPNFNTMTISQAPNWTELGLINFEIIAGGTGEFAWSYNGGTTEIVVFLGDEATQIFATSSDVNSCLIGVSVPLPVELLNFRTESEMNQLKLMWQTASEINNKGFDILRSKNGIDWTSIGWVDGAGTTTELKNYQLVDNQPFNGINYYQLNQIDLDGNSKLSEVKSVQFKRKNNKIFIYPNPANGQITIAGLAKETTPTIQISNALGQNVLTTHKTNIDISHLPKGIYTVEVQSADGVVLEMLLRR